jgi:hypothetical protein
MTIQRLPLAAVLLASIAPLANAQTCTEIPLPPAVTGSDSYPAIATAVSPTGRWLIVEIAAPDAALELSTGLDPQRNFHVVDLETQQVRQLTNTIDTNTRPLGWTGNDNFSFYTVASVTSFNNFGVGGGNTNMIRLVGNGLFCNLDVRQSLPACPGTPFRQANAAAFYLPTINGQANNGWLQVNERVYDRALYPRPTNAVPAQPVLAARGPLIENIVTGEQGTTQAQLEQEVCAAAALTPCPVTPLGIALPSETGRRLFIDSNFFLTGPQKGVRIQGAPGNNLQVQRLRYHFDRDTGQVQLVVPLKLDTPLASLTGYTAGADAFPFFQYANDGNRATVYVRAPLEPLPNHNPDGSAEVYLWDRGTVRTIMPNLPRFTYNGVEDTFDPTRASISPNGRFALFTSRRNLVGRNADGSAELYRVNVDSGQILQVSDEGGGDAYSAVLARFGLTATPTVQTTSIGSFATGYSSDGTVLSAYFESSRAVRNSGSGSFEFKRFSSRTKVYRCPP